MKSGGQLRKASLFKQERCMVAKIAVFGRWTQCKAT